jgi:hypothetical protein
VGHCSLLVVYLSIEKQEIMNKTILTNNFSETQNFGEEFAKQLKGGEVIALHGDLG